MSTAGASTVQSTMTRDDVDAIADRVVESLLEPRSS
jgi:hypothetical protein